MLDSLLARTRRYGALIPLLIVAACGSSSGEKPAAGTTAPLTCATNADCSGNAVCTSDPSCSDDCKFTCHAACDASTPCADGQWCRIETFTHHSYCASRSALGAACAVNENVDSRATVDDPCVDGAWCGPHATCVAQIAENAPCPTPYAPFECPTGFACSGPEGATACHPLVAQGGACGDDRDCDASLYCDAASHTCAPRVAAGGMCDESSQYMCVAGTDCTFATMLDCTADRDCVGGRCCAMPDGLGLCTDMSTADCSLPKGTCK